MDVTFNLVMGLMKQRVLIKKLRRNGKAYGNVSNVWLSKHFMVTRS